jgi:putative transposase
MNTKGQRPGGSAASPTPKKAREAAGPPKCHDRKHPVHLPNVQRFNQPVILFVTVATKNRETILANERVHTTLIKIWPRATHYFVGRYVIMPDHLHLFCSPSSHETENVKTWVAYWKRLVSVELRDLNPIWQTDCWDTQLRQARHYDEKWEYVVQNPVRKGLVDSSEKWPYQGCLNELRW